VLLVTSEVRDAPRLSRYEIVVDGVVAGFSEYRDVDGVRVFTHTEIDDAFEGRGLGSQLVRGALDDAVAARRAIVALCPFVDRMVGKHPEEYGALVDADLDARLRRRASRRPSSSS
jgi:uncharacterized protein